MFRPILFFLQTICFIIFLLGYGSEHFSDSNSTHMKQNSIFSSGLDSHVDPLDLPIDSSSHSHNSFCLHFSFLNAHAIIIDIYPIDITLKVHYAFYYKNPHRKSLKIPPLSSLS